jgi:dipeptidyl aminopeptidase/acylaminoacyl peptidase
MACEFRARPLLDDLGDCVVGSRSDLDASRNRAGARIAVASDREAAIWDADTGLTVTTFSTPGSAEVKEIAWSPDGRRVVTSADDGVLRFWSASDGGLLASLYILDSRGDWLLVAPNGRLDGSQRALARMVAWRVGERVFADGTLTRRHRVRDLWRSLSLRESRQLLLRFAGQEPRA